MDFVATNIEKKKISDSEFEIPDGYEIKSRDEMRSMMGGGQ